MRTRAHGSIAAAIAILAAAGCGGGANGGGAPARTATTPRAAAPAPVAAAQPTGTPADAATTAAVKAVGERYLHAMAAQDAEAACATRTPKERQDMATLSGSCPRLYRRTFQIGGPSRTGDATVVDVRLRGPYAVATYEADGHRIGGDDALVAQRVGGRWLLVDHDFAPTLTSSGAASERAIRAVADRFLHALARKDWKTACATRTPQDRRELVDYSGGTCEDALQVLARQAYAPASMHAGRVTFGKAGTATVAVVQGHDATGADSLRARRVGATWLLESSSDSYDLP